MVVPKFRVVSVFVVKKLCNMLPALSDVPLNFLPFFFYFQCIQLLEFQFNLLPKLRASNSFNLIKSTWICSQYISNLFLVVSISILLNFIHLRIKCLRLSSIIQFFAVVKHI